MWSSAVLVYVLVAISAVCSRPYDFDGKDDGSLFDSIREEIQKHLEEFDIPDDFIMGGSLAKSGAETASITGKGHHHESLSAAAAEAAAVSVADEDDYYKHGGVSVAKAAAASKAVSSDHYGKESAAMSAAAAEAAAFNLKKKEHYKPDHRDKLDYDPEPNYYETHKHYLHDQPQGDDPHAHFSGSKAAAAAESVSKSFGDKYHKGASLAKSLAKAESFSAKGISASSALVKSVNESA